MLSTLPEVSLEVVGLGVIAACYSGFLLRRWWISRNEQARVVSPSGEAVIVAEKETKVKSRAAQRPFGGSSLSLSLLSGLIRTHVTYSFHSVQCVQYVPTVTNRMDAGPVRVSFHNTR